MIPYPPSIGSTCRMAASDRWSGLARIFIETYVQKANAKLTIHQVVSLEMTK